MYRTLLLVVAFVASFSGAPALAQDVAVLEFDGYGVPYDQITRLSRGLQDAFLGEGSYTPVDEFALADRLSAGRASDISEARKLISEARKSLDLGNAAGALRNLEDALRLHEGAGSHIARRPELADAHYLAGDALLRLGRSYDAERHFVDTLYLYPGYPEQRARKLSSTARSVFNRAAATIASADPRLPTTSDLDALSRALGVEAIVVGYANDRGVIFARMVRGTRVVGEVSKTFSEIVPEAGEPLYPEMVTALLSGDTEPREAGGYVAAPPAFDDPYASSGVGNNDPYASSGVGDSDPYASSGVGDSDPYASSGDDFGFAPLPGFDDEQPAPGDDLAPDGGGGEAAATPKREKSPRLRKNEVGKIESRGRIRYKDEPVTRQWWFWTATGAVVVGGGVTAAVLVLSDGDSPEDIGGDSVYAVTVETGS